MRKRTQARNHRPTFDVLEDRLVPTTIVVQNLNDSGAGSLRDAISQVNNSTDPANAIGFSAGLTGTITLDSALPAFARTVNLSGPGAKMITVARSSAGGTPAFAIFTVGAGLAARISGLTITGGQAADGGGISNHGFLELEGAAVTGNTATDKGGGVFSDAPNPAPGSRTPAGVAIISSVISNDTTSGSGGAAGIDIESGPLLLRNSTVSGNQSLGGDNAGGVAVNGGTAQISFSTISANTATGPVNAGGLDAQAPTGLVDTLLAGNASGSPDVDVRGTQFNLAATDLGASGHDLIGNGTGAPQFVNGSNGDQVGTAGNPLDPKLGPLQDNGGATPAMALLPGSPAIDAGVNPVVGSHPPASVPDQRGFVRVAGNSVDIGAYEAGSTQLAVMLAIAPSQGAAAAVAANTPVSFVAVVAPGVVGASPTLPGGTVHFTVDGQAAADVAVANGRAVLNLPSGLAPGAHAIAASYTSTNSPAFANSSASRTIDATGASPVPVPAGSPGGLTGDLTTLVRVTVAAPAGGRGGRARGLRRDVTITNTAGQALQGPVTLVLRGLKRTVRLRGAGGFVGTGKMRRPFLAVGGTAGTLIQPNETLTLTLRFSARPNHFTVSVFAGSVSLATAR
jgi:hypothetical protein